MSYCHEYNYNSSISQLLRSLLHRFDTLTDIQFVDTISIPHVLRNSYHTVETLINTVTKGRSKQWVVSSDGRIIDGLINLSHV